MEGISPVISLGLAVQNTSNQSFTLNSLAGEVYSNKYLIGHIGTFTAQRVNPNSETSVNVDCRLSPLGIVSDMINAIVNKTFTQAIELDMTANIDNLQVPINLKFKFGK